MKKPLFIAIAAIALLVSNCEQTAKGPPDVASAMAVLEDCVIEGTLRYSLAPQQFKVRISGQTIKLPIAEGADLSGWITNLPAGLAAASKDLYPSGGTEVVLVISGDPVEESESPIALTIPEGWLTEYKALPAVFNPNAKFGIIKPDAAVSDVNIAWKPGLAPVQAAVTVTLFRDNTKFNAISAGTGIDWIKNLPAGLTQKLAQAIEKDAAEAQIEVSGTPDPVVILKEPLQIEIPAEVLSDGVPITVRTNRYAVFALSDGTERSATLSDVTVNGVRNFSQLLSAPPMHEGAEDIHPLQPVEYKRDIAVEPRDFTVSLNKDSFNKAIAKGADLSDWVTNLVPGLNAKAKEAVASGGTELTVTVSGKPTGARTAPIALTIPAAFLTNSGEGALTANENPSARFYIPNPQVLLPKATATVDPVSIVGVTGSPLVEPADVQISISNDSLASPIENGTAVTWLDTPDGLEQKITDTTVSAGVTYITLRVSGTPSESVQPRPVKLTIPKDILVCGVELEAMPEVAVKYVIAETPMTLAESLALVPITGGTVAKEPDHTYKGGSSSMGFPREPGPFAASSLPITVPSFMMGKYEVSNKLWYEVAKWSEERADENLKYNYGGHSETAIDPTGKPKEFFPRVFVSQEEAWLWCNAFTEYWNENIRTEGELEKTPYIVNNLTDKTPIRTKTEMVQALKAPVVQDPEATGFRLPSPAEWEYAARGGVVDGPQWNWNWPGTNEFSKVKDYAWVDSLRIYDTYQNEIRIGMLLPNAAGLHDMGGNVHEWTTKPDSLDPSQTITRGGAFNRNEDRSGFDESRQELKPASSRDIIGFRVICAIPEQE